ncbi:MAG: hypothetical protein GY940_11650, partial [bacterium]|nr:hypothetical protein [bacterium]
MIIPDKPIYPIHPFNRIKPLILISLLILTGIGCSGDRAPEEKTALKEKPEKQLTDPRIENIETFTRLYGYVRYFYPGDEAAALDWERFAVYGVKRVEPAAGRDQLKKVLKELFLPVAPALEIYETGTGTPYSTASITPADSAGMKVVTWQHLGVGI